MKLSNLIATASLLLSGAASALAIPITVTTSTTGSGSLNGVAFTNVLVTLTLNGDTEDVTGSPVFFLPGTATVMVAGIGTDNFTDNINAVVNQNIPAGGISDSTVNRAILFASNPGFSTYSLQASVGPLTGAPIYNPNFAFSTAGGSFLLSSVGDATFTAVTAAVGAPEPSSMLPLGTAIIALAGIRKKSGSAMHRD